MPKTGSVSGAVKCLVVLLVFMFYTISLAVGLCHTSSDHNSFKYLATKTPYRYVQNKDESKITFKGCEPTRIWMVVRHGTRNPGAKMIRKMRERLPILQAEILASHEARHGLLCTEDLSVLRRWQPHVEEVNEKKLTHEGEDEMIELAERFQNRFPTLFPEPYTNSTYKFRYTATQRTAASARSFATGLFGRKVSQHVWFPEAIHRDPILRFYKLCSRWRTEVDKNPASYLERAKFEQGPHMRATLEDMRQRLGLKQITFDDVHVMYSTCSFETAWERHHASPWCSMFSDDNLKVLEYAEDLEYYWIDGYGYDITYKQACPAFRDMMQTMLASEQGATAITYFTHSGTMLKMLSHLGLYQDMDELRHDTFNTTAVNRKWRVGRMDSFATNLAFVLFQCGTEKKVLAMHQERAVTLPGCPSDELCHVDIMAAEFSESIHECNFSEMCALTNP